MAKTGTKSDEQVSIYFVQFMFEFDNAVFYRAVLYSDSRIFEDKWNWIQRLTEMIDSAIKEHLCSSRYKFFFCNRLSPYFTTAIKKEHNYFPKWLFCLMHHWVGKFILSFWNLAIGRCVQALFIYNIYL